MKKEDLKIFNNPPQLTTKRLVLRKILKKDLDDVFEYASDEKVPEFLLWHPHKNKEYTKAYLSYITKLYKKGKFYDWGITIEGKLIGTVGFTAIDLNNNCAEIGYVLNSSFWGKGIATEAVEEIIKFGFNVLSFNRIEALFLPQNSASRNVLKKCGMQFESVKRSALVVKGEVSDVEVYSITKEDFFKE